VSAKKQKKAPNVLRVAMWLCVMAVFIAVAGLVYYFAGATPSLYEKIVIYALLGGAVLVILRLAVWGFGWVRKERVSELGLHIVRFAVILAAVTLCVFAMMSSDYTAQYRQSAGNELRQQALAARIQMQDMLGEELGTDAPYYQELYASLPELLDSSRTNDGRHVNLYLFVPADRQPAGTAFDSLEGSDGIFAAGTNSRLGVTASAEYIDRVYRSGELTFSEYSKGEGSFRSAFVPVFTTAGRPVGVLEVCEPGAAAASALFGLAAIELLLRVAALIAMFSFGFYGVMQLLDILMRPRSVDRSCRVLSCGREAARPVLFFVALSAALPLMLLLHAREMQSLISISALPAWLDGVTALLPAGLYMACFLLGWVLVRKTRQRLTEAPSNISLIMATVYTILLMLIKDTDLFADVAILQEWYIPLALIALCGVCYGVSYRTISKYQAQSDMLFGKDKYAYLCTALGAITGVILGAWLLDASGEAGVKVAMLLFNIAACVISIKLLEDLDQTVDISERSSSRIASLGGLMLPVVPMGIALGFVWIYVAGFLGKSDYSVTARSIITVAPVVAFCFGNRLRVKSRTAQRVALCLGGALAAISYLPMVWTPAPVMAVVSCGLLCLAVVFMSAGVYSSLLPNERGGAFVGLALGAVIGAAASGLLQGFYAGRLALLIMGGITLLLSLLMLATKFPNRIPGPEIHEGITGEGGYFAPPPVFDEPAEPKKKEKKPREKKEKPPKEPKEPKQPKEKKEKKKKEKPLPVVLHEDESSDKPMQDEPAEEKPAAEPQDDFFAAPEPKDDFFGETEQPKTEEKDYNWEDVDVRTANVMDEFMNDNGSTPTEDTAASFFDEDPMPIIIPDAPAEDAGFTPDGGAISKSSESLGSDEGFIDFGL